MRAFSMTCAALLFGCSHAVEVHGGNLIELDAAPGTVAISAVHGQTTLTLQAPAVPWQGRMLAPVPLLPVASGESWALTYRPHAGHPRSATLVANPQTGAPGSLALQFIQALGSLDARLTAPTATEALAVYNRNIRDLKSTITFVQATVAQAQTAPAPVGARGGITVNFDPGGASYLDGAIAAAQEPAVALYSPGFQAKPNVTAALSLMLAASSVLAMPAAADFAAADTTVTALGADFIAQIVAAQAMTAVLSADRAGDPESTAVANLLGYGPVRAQTVTASRIVEASASGATRSGAHQADRVSSLSCDPAGCVRGSDCAACSALFSGCFASGSACCGSGFWTIACNPGDACAVCNGIYTCLPPGASCGGFGTGTVAGDAFFERDAGYPDGGPIGPERCGLAGLAGGDTPDSRIIELGKDAGAFLLEWNTYGVADDIVVSYESKVIFDSGCVASAGTPTIPFRGLSSQVTVSVTPDCRGGTSGSQWEYRVGCP
jgi:hypothetical protein